jgi:hypothetical protein
VAGATPTTPVASMFDPTPALFDYFGKSVAISGTKIVVGAEEDATDGNQAGSAYEFNLNSATPGTAVRRFGSPSAAPAFDHYGAALALSGSRLAVAAKAEPNGECAVYVYDLDAVEPTTVTHTLLSGGNGSRASVVMLGTRIVVGVPASIANGYFGKSFVYELTSGTPATPVLTLENPTPAADDYFGAAVAISATRIVVGAPQDDTATKDAGLAYLYDASAATATPTTTLEAQTLATLDHFGTHVALSGSLLVVGVSDDDTGGESAGSAYVYDLAGATPTAPIAVLKNPAPAADEHFGAAVAISGTTVVVGVPGRFGTLFHGNGKAYVYEMTSADRTVPTMTLVHPSPSVTDGFGGAVAFSGRRVAVATLTGFRACVFDLDSNTATVPVAVLSRTGGPGEHRSALAFSGK